jgi:heme a synthase
MTRTVNYHPWLHRFAMLTAAATLALVGIGGLVTSHEAGMAVPDWPTSYGYNPFLFPLDNWWHTGNIFYEHSHRLFASGVGFLTIILAVWLWVKDSRWWLRWLGVAALFAVVLQGVLGGLRVVLIKDEIGIFHATLAQLFFVTTCAIALFTSKRWLERRDGSADLQSAVSQNCILQGVSDSDDDGESERSAECNSAIQQSATLGYDVGNRAGLEAGALGLRRLVIAATALIFFQLVLGATMRHQHAGLAISDFPLAHGKVWPAMDAASIATYNAQRSDLISLNPITAFQVGLQMTHRIMALLILAAVAGCAWIALRRLTWRNSLTKGALIWFGLILIQAGLGAATVLTNKAADVATAHVLTGALSLATGALLCIFSVCNPESVRYAPALSRVGAQTPEGSSFAAETAAVQ